MNLLAVGSWILYSWPVLSGVLVGFVLGWLGGWDAGHARGISAGVEIERDRQESVMEQGERWLN